MDDQSDDFWGFRQMAANTTLRGKLEDDTPFGSVNQPTPLEEELRRVTEKLLLLQKRHNKLVAMSSDPRMMLLQSIWPMDIVKLIHDFIPDRWCSVCKRYFMTSACLGRVCAPAAPIPYTLKGNMRYDAATDRFIFESGVDEQVFGENWPNGRFWAHRKPTGELLTNNYYNKSDYGVFYVPVPNNIRGGMTVRFDIAKKDQTPNDQRVPDGAGF